MDSENNAQNKPWEVTRIKFHLGLAMVAIWWPVLAFVCLSIHSRVQAKFFTGLLVASGINGAPSNCDIFFLYRQDLILFGVLFPILTVWCFTRLRFSLFASIFLGLVFIVQVLLYLNLQSWGQVGSFLTWQALCNAITFGLSNPEFIGEYISADGMMKFILLILFSTAVILAGSLIFRHPRLIRLWSTMGGLSIILFGGLSAIGYTSEMRTTPISGSFFGNAVFALFNKDAYTTTLPPKSELNARYAKLSEISMTAFEGPNIGVHKGSNLVLFIMETASIEFLDTRKEWPDHPVFDALKDKIFVANNHFSTFPASAESNFSILTGSYPPKTMYGTCLTDIPRTGGTLPGPIAQLKGLGYKTAIYAPYESQVPADKVIFEGTGFEKVVYGTALTGPGGAEKLTFEAMLMDITKWAEVGQPFAATYLPQIGHGPWRPELGATIQQRGARIVRDQLNWLLRVVEVLRTTKQLENTVIVLTGDHGVRTSAEDPRVKVGMIDWYSFHVPLMLYAPKAQYSMLNPNLPTSHIDLASELDELMGLAPLPSYQGLAFHNPERKTRRGFMMAGWYFGANGYREPSKSAMYSDMLDAVYVRSDGHVEFGSEHLLITEQGRADIRDRLSGMISLQEVWITDRLCSNLGMTMGK